MASTSQTIAAPPLPFRKTNASVLLDLIRGSAAIIVLLSHWRLILFKDYGSQPHHNPLLLLLYVVTATGRQAVMVFFVLSGYLIGGSVFRALEYNRWSWADYLLHRIVRLWLVLIPGLFLGLLWDWIGLHHTHAFLLYQNGVDNHLAPFHPLTAVRFLGNAAFLQMLVGTFGSNGVLWSLCNEFWYYILFPIGLLALWKSTRPATRLFYIALFLLLAWKPTSSLLPVFPVWLAGVLLTRMPALRLKNSIRILVTALYLVIYLGIGHQSVLTGLQTDFVFGLFTFFFFWVILSANSAARDTLSVRFSRNISGFSYTLYIVHFPLLMLFTALLVGDDRWTFSAAHLVIACALLLVILPYAWFIAACTEAHTHRLVTWIKARTGIY